MSGTITTGNFPKALWPGINTWWGQMYGEHGEECRQLFDFSDSTKAYEEDVEATGFGLAPKKAEGSSIQYDSHQQGIITRYNNEAYALGFVITHEELKDNQYKDVSSMAFDRTRMLRFSMDTTKETVSANVYNRAFNSSYTGGDGVQLISTAHPTLDGTQANRLAADADLSEASLEDMCILVDNFDNTRGLPIKARTTKLIIPTALKFEATRILESQLQNDTANNAVNALKTTGAVDEIVVNHYLTDEDAWFLRTNVPNGMRLFEREALGISQDNDFDTKNFKVAAYMRFVPGWSDFRGIVGSAGA